MPIYTFKCRTCGEEEEHLRDTSDFKEPICPWCCYDPNIQGKDERMERVINKMPDIKIDGYWESDKKLLDKWTEESTTKAFERIWEREYGEKLPPDKKDDDNI